MVQNMILTTHFGEYFHEWKHVETAKVVE